MLNMLRSSCTLSSTILRRMCTSVSTMTVKETLLKKPIDQKILVQGWVQAIRKHKDLYFVDLVDGTCFERLQIVINANNYKTFPSYGSSIKAEGSIVKSLHKGQEVELIVDSWDTLGSCENDYPFVNHQKHSAEYIRQLVHLRPRTKHFSSMLRIRNHASMAIHKFFQDEGFCFVHTPIITQNDCEGGGEVFSVEAKGKLSDALLEVNKNLEPKNIDSAEKEKLKDSGNISDQKLKEHFFGAPAFLTVSGQLHLEALACALTRVYNFGPTFRAEGSQTRQHASEFQMIEGEMAFIERIDDLLQVVENCIKKLIESMLNDCNLEVNFICQEHKNHNKYLDAILSKPFVKMSYKDAITVLQQNKHSLRIPIEYGQDLAADHKQFLVKHCDNVPVFVCMFPSSIKPFYMKNDENNMASCFDLFAAYGGEICGGSLREENQDILERKYSFENNQSLKWYLDLRKYGTVPHGGFGIGFERLLQSLLGISNIRDVLPFPRRKSDCKC